MSCCQRIVERNGIEINDFVLELGSFIIVNLMEKVRGLQNLVYQLGLDECEYLDYIYLGLYVVYFMMSFSYNLEGIFIRCFEGKKLL